MIEKQILHYKIAQKLGEGGMGVVYKAEDTKLGRAVALKMLPPHLLTSNDDKARFQREAKAAAALNHTNIATVFEINEHEGTPFIAMEYIEGQTLNHHIEKGPFKLHDAIDIAVQVAEGLKAAHNKGIVHRDIKSSNIILDPDKKVKILDFGLAKTAMSTKLTQMGSTIGTVAYMSPEQVSGKEVDHRTDLWSLGVVLFETLTGKYPFAGDYDQVVFYNILNQPPEPLTGLRTGVPMSLEWIINKLLAKNPAERYQNANDLIIDLKAIDLSATGMSRVSGSTVQTHGESAQIRKEIQPGLAIKKGTLYNPMVITGSILLGVLAATLVFWTLNLKADKDLRKYSWPLEYDNFAISPDGQKIAYSPGNMLYIRHLDQLEPIEIKNDKYISNIFWSPNSDYVAYFNSEGSNRWLRKVAVDGTGDVLVTKTTENYYPRYWGVDDSIVVSTWDSHGWNTLLKVSALGGELIPMYGGDSSLAMIVGNLTHVHRLPASNNILLSIISYKKSAFEIYIQDDKKRSLFYSGPPESRIGRFMYADPGFILYTRRSVTGEAIPDMWAIPVDLSSLQVSGKEFLVAGGAGKFSVSQNGMLIYKQQRAANAEEQLVLLSRSGRFIKNISQAQQGIYSPAITQDGKRIATTSRIGDDNFNIWIHDIDKGIKAQLTFDFGVKPSWSPDGNQIIFQSSVTRESDIYIQETNSVKKPQALISAEGGEDNPHWSADGRFVFYSRVEEENQDQRNIWYLDLKKKNSPQCLFQSAFQDNEPFMSPDGKFVAYSSDKSGQIEIYVTDFPEARHQWQVSFNGGDYPQWIGDELFFINPATNTLFVSKIKTEPEFQSDIPQELCSPDEAEIDLNMLTYRFAITPDGQNIVAVKRQGEILKPQIVMVENWYNEFKEK